MNRLIGCGGLVFSFCFSEGMTDKVDTVPGENLQYSDQVTFGAITSRKEVVITPKYGGSFKAGNILRIEVPAQDYIDPEKVYMSFKSQLFAGASNSWWTTVTTGGAGLDATSGIPELTPARMHSSNANCMKTVRFRPGVQCIFARIKVLAGSTVIEDIQDYADLYRFMLEATTSPEWRRHDGAEQEGFYDPADVQQTISVSNHHSKKIVSAVDPTSLYTKTDYESPYHVYTVRPMVGLLNVGKLLPVKYMGNLTFEFYMNENSECLWSSSSALSSLKAYGASAAAIPTGVTTGPVMAHTLGSANVADPTHATASGQHLAFVEYVGDGAGSRVAGQVVTDFPNAYYQISDVEMHVSFVTVLPDFDAAMLNKIESGGLDLHFSTFHEHTRNVTSTGNQSLQFTERSLSVKGGFVVMRNSDDIRDIRTDTTFKSNNIEYYQWKIGNEYIPAQRVECSLGGARAQAQLKMTLGTFDDFGESNNISEDDYLPKYAVGDVNTQHLPELKRCAAQPSKFAIGLSLEKAPGQMSGFDSAAAGVDIELQFKLRDHADNFGGAAYTATYAFSNTLGARTWQPSKFKVYTCNSPEPNVGNLATATGLSMDAIEDYRHNDLGGKMRVGILGLGTAIKPGAFPPGVMQAKSCLYSSGGTKAGATFTSAHEIVAAAPVFSAVSEVGKYTRVQFYAHVDSLLRIRRVGQLEVVV